MSWRKVLIAGVVVAAAFTVLAFAAQSAFWLLVGGGVLMLTGMLLFIMGARAPQVPSKHGRRRR